MNLTAKEMISKYKEIFGSRHSFVSSTLLGITYARQST